MATRSSRPVEGRMTARGRANASTELSDVFMAPCARRACAQRHPRHPSAEYLSARRSDKRRNEVRVHPWRRKPGARCQATWRTSERAVSPGARAPGRVWLGDPPGVAASPGKSMCADGRPPTAGALCCFAMKSYDPSQVIGCLSRVTRPQSFPFLGKPETENRARS